MEKLINRKNYLWVREFLTYLTEVKLVSPQSSSRYWFHLRHLLLWAMDVPFNQASSIRPTFPAYVISLSAPNGKNGLAYENQRKILDMAKQFFLWAKMNHPGDFRAISSGWPETLHLPRQKQYADSDHVYVTLEETIRLANTAHSEGDLAQRRDCAAAAFLFLSGMRAGAFVTLPIGAVDLGNGQIKQWPEMGVMTKNSKKATTFLLPIPELYAIVKSWDDFVHSSLSPTDFWYAPMENHWGELSLSKNSPGKSRNNAIDRRLKLLFSQAGLPYRSAHKFRHGHAVYGLQHARTMADYKAILLNLMHEDIKVTDQIYAPLINDEVKERIAGLAGSSPTRPDGDLSAYFNTLSDADLSISIRIAAERMVR